MTTTLRSRRTPCALHGLAVADDGLCVRCRRPSEEDRGGGVGWPMLFALGCCAAGLIGWQAAKMGPEALSLRPQHHLAVISLEATSPVEQLRADEQRATRARRLVRPEPVAAAHAPGAVAVTITPAQQKALEEPSLPPVIYGGSVPNQEPATTKVVVTFAPEQPAEVPVFRGRGPVDAAGGGSRRHRRAVPNRPVLLPPPGGSLPGGGTGELWNPRGPSAARTAPRARSAARSSPRSAARTPMMSGGRSGTASARPRGTRSRGRR